MRDSRVDQLREQVCAKLLQWGGVRVEEPVSTLILSPGPYICTAISSSPEATTTSFAQVEGFRLWTQVGQKPQCQNLNSNLTGAMP